MLKFSPEPHRIGVASLTLFARYFVGGLVATILHIMVLTLLVELGDVEPLLATSIGFCLAVVVNYSFQYHWAFGASGPHRSVFPRYLTVTLLMLGLNSFLFRVLTEGLAIQYVVAQLVATAVVMFCNFGANRRFTFKDRCQDASCGDSR